MLYYDCTKKANTVTGKPTNRFYREELYMKKHTLRAAASVLTAALLMTTLTGCAGGGSNNDGGGSNNSNGGNPKNGTLAVSLDHSYASDKIAIDGLQYVQGAITFGDKLLVVGADTSYNDLLYLYNPADGSAKNVEFAYPKTLGENAEAYPSSLFMDSDGNLNILFSASCFQDLICQYGIL